MPCWAARVEPSAELSAVPSGLRSTYRGLFRPVSAFAGGTRAAFGSLPGISACLRPETRTGEATARRRGPNQARWDCKYASARMADDDSLRQPADRIRRAPIQCSASVGVGADRGDVAPNLRAS
jgi:hypothetical protein